MIRFLLCGLFVHVGMCDLITVETSRGTVQGFDQDLGSDKTQRFYGYGQIFLGIPFAKPPIGSLRFALPEELCQYNEKDDVHNATYYRPSCWQDRKKAMSEDCLYLNVMTPNVISGNYPVMVYIHGGTFATGGAEKYHWKGAIRNLVSRGVVVVTIQYRVGLFGFFTTFTETFPPNRGIYDQILALRWVKEEIMNFGGDAIRITVFGESAGAGAVSVLTLSPLARGLFHQIIQESGSALLQIETITDPRGSIHQNRASQNGPLFWSVSIDGALMPDYPENLAESRPKYRAIIGDMADEFVLMIPGAFNRDLSNITSTTNQELFQYYYPNYDDTTAKNFSDTMINGYSNGVLPLDDDHLGWTKLIGDAFTGLVYSSMMVRDVQWHQAAGNEDVWAFTFTYRSPLSSPIEFEDGWRPVPHGAEEPYIWFFPTIWENYNASVADLEVADYFGELWTNFAKKGELPLPRIGDRMSYADMGESITLKRNWRSTANTVYNEQIPSYLGEFPPLSMTDDTMAKIRMTGEKILSKWNSMKRCAVKPTESPTTKGAPISVLSTLVFIVLITFF